MTPGLCVEGCQSCAGDGDHAHAVQCQGGIGCSSGVGRGGVYMAAWCNEGVERTSMWHAAWWPVPHLVQPMWHVVPGGLEVGQPCPKVPF